MKQLTGRQERFCRKFVELRCATTAARAAGYTPEWANNAGYPLMRQPRIVRRIAEIEGDRGEGRAAPATGADGRRHRRGPASLTTFDDF